MQKYLWYMTVTASRTVSLSKSIEETVLSPLPFLPSITRFKIVIFLIIVILFILSFLVQSVSLI